MSDTSETSPDPTDSDIVEADDRRHDPTEPDLRDDAEEDALIDAGGDAVGTEPDGSTDIEGPNSL